MWLSLSFCPNCHHTDNSLNGHFHYLASTCTFMMQISWYHGQQQYSDVAVVFKWNSRARSVPKKSPQTVTSPAVWSLNAKQDGAMISCCLCQILTARCRCHSRNWDTPDQPLFFQSSVVQFWWTNVNCCIDFRLLADRSNMWCGLLLP